MKIEMMDNREKQEMILTVRIPDHEYLGLYSTVVTSDPLETGNLFVHALKENILALIRHAKGILV